MQQLAGRGVFVTILRHRRFEIGQAMQAGSPQ